jgi:hypothetical protein
MYASTCSGLFGHNAAGEFCMGPAWLAAPFTILVCVIIVIMFAWGANIWAWGQQQRAKGGFFGILFWIIASIIATIGMFLGWSIGFIGALIIAGAIIGWLLKGGK